jgi:uncharacterized protein (TIGR00251 family)
MAIHMKLIKTAQGSVLDVHVKPNSKEFKIKIEEDELIVFCRATPINGRVNKEVIKQLSKLFKKRTEILSGFTSKQKRILMRDVSAEEVNEILSKYILKHVQ